MPSVTYKVGLTMTVYLQMWVLLMVFLLFLFLLFPSISTDVGATYGVFSLFPNGFSTL